MVCPIIIMIIVLIIIIIIIFIFILKNALFNCRNKNPLSRIVDVFFAHWIWTILESEWKENEQEL